MKKTREQLMAELTPLRDEIDRIDRAEQERERKKLIGKCFKYRNSYSMPQKDSDYWPIYVKVVGADGYRCRAFTFQTDKDGKIKIEPQDYFSARDGYKPITAAEFNREWKALKARIAKLKP